MARRKLKHPIRVSSLAFHKDRWTRREAVAWLRSHGHGSFRAADFSSTKNYWTVRLLEVPKNTCDYRREHWGESGILATYCVPKARAPKVVRIDFDRVSRSIKRRRAG